MTLAEIEQRIDVMRKLAPDWEAVHGSEDALLWDFVEFVDGFGHVANSGAGKLAALLMDWHKESEDDPRWAA